MKKALTIASALLFAVATQAATPIATVGDYIDNVFADPAGDYVLTADLEFSGLAAIPEFSGTFDGDGHKITGLSSNLVGVLTGTLENLTIHDHSFQHQRVRSNVCDPMAAFVAELRGGTVSGCTLRDGQITMPDGYAANLTTSGLAGIVGNVGVGGGVISNCEVIGCRIGCRTGTVEQLQPFGGIVGRVGTSDPVVISECRTLNHGDIVTTIAGCNVGGILGSASGASSVRIEGCYCEGVVTNATLTAGGIMGCCDGGNTVTAVIDIRNCTNSIAIAVGCGGVGGIFGYTYKAGSIQISGCVNYGDITSSYDSVSHNAKSGTGTGGIVGGMYSYPASGGLRIDCSANYGAVLASTNSAGGLVGEYKNGNAATKCLVSNSVNHASVTSSHYAGGLVGAFTRTANAVKFELVNCCQTGNVSAIGEESAGGLIGYVFEGLKNVCYICGVCQLGTVSAANSSASPMIGSTGHETKAFTLNVNSVQIGGSATCANGTTGIITGGAESTSTGAFTVNVDADSNFADTDGTAYYDQTGTAQSKVLNALPEHGMTDKSAVRKLNAYATANSLVGWVQTAEYPDLEIFGKVVSNGFVLTVF